jgi:hypothetical protein
MRGRFGGRSPNGETGVGGSRAVPVKGWARPNRTASSDERTTVEGSCVTLRAATGVVVGARETHVKVVDVTGNVANEGSLGVLRDLQPLG